MEIRQPCIITPRLLPGVHIADAFLSIEYAGTSFDGRTIYRVWLDCPDFECEDVRLQSGVGGGTLQAGLASVLSFMSAAAESYRFEQRTGRPGEHTDLFAKEVVEWCYQHDDEISMLALEIEEAQSPLIEE